jgi:multicomponent Na+:H+ antiporter subunit D
MNILPLFVVIPLFTAFSLPIFAKFKRDFSGLLANLTTIALFVLSCVSIYLVSSTSTIVYTIGGWAVPIGINLVLDGFSVLLLVTISLVSMMVTIFSLDYMKKFTDMPKYYTLLMLMIVGMNGVVLTGDFFNMFVFVEIAAVASYALVAFGTESEELEAAFKYMILGSVASAFILLAVIIIYATTGSLNMAHVSSIIAERGVTPPVQLCFALFLMGFSIKAALVPFHAWLPDAHPSAPAPISAMLSGVLIKAIGIYALSRIIFNVFGLSFAFSEILMILGTVSMIVGVLLAIGQWDFKRLLAYHSVSQMGYVVLGLGLGTPLGILGGLFHLFNHASFKSLLFLNSGSVEYSTGTRNLKEMGGLKEKLPVTSATSLVASASIAGIPPFNGFWSKLMIIVAAVTSGHPMYALAAVIASILTLASFLKVQRYAFFGKLKGVLSEAKEAPALMCVAMIGFAIVCTAAGILFPFVLDYLINPAVSVLLNGLGYSGIILGG